VVVTAQIWDDVGNAWMVEEPESALVRVPLEGIRLEFLRDRDDPFEAWGAHTRGQVSFWETRLREIDRSSSRLLRSVGIHRRLRGWRCLGKYNFTRVHLRLSLALTTAGVGRHWGGDVAEKTVKRRCERKIFKSRASIQFKLWELMQNNCIINS
jgi:hypothetical protein